VLKFVSFPLKIKRMTEFIQFCRENPTKREISFLYSHIDVEALKKQRNNKAHHAVINFMYDLLACQRDQGITEAMQNKGGLKDAQWMEVDCLESLGEVHRLLNLHKTVVETGSSGPPETGSRSLQSYASESADDPAMKEELRKK
jgi:hypothetical protein